MRRHLMLPMISALGLTLAGCATPPENPQLLQAREAYSQLQAKPEASGLAAIESQAAGEALNRANQLSAQNRQAPELNQLSYLAQQQIDLAEQIILSRKTDAELKAVDAERTQVQLDVRTQQLKALQAMRATPSSRGQIVTFGDVLFDTGKAELKYTSQNNLQQLAQFLRDNPERNVRIEGFTDSTGSELFNLQLSERRAVSVKHALERLGISPERLLTKGYGTEFSISDNSSVQGRQLNRRVEVIISNDASAVSPRE